MKTAHLFSGAGGGLLADLILGHEPVLAIDNSEFCCRSLEERAREGWFPGLQIHCGDIREFDFAPWKGRVDCIAAGFPCQDISCAGHGKGIKGARSGLVSEVWRAVDSIRPRFVFLENSPLIRTRGRREIIMELVARGYSWRDGTIKASDVGASHIRKRWFFLASDINGLRQLERARKLTEERRRHRHAVAEDSDINGQRGRIEQQFGICETARAWNESAWSIEDPADALRQRLQVAVLQGGLSQAEADTIQATAGYTGAYDWSPPDSGVCRVVDGVSFRMERIKACGNAQVPLQAAAAWMILAGSMFWGETK